MLHQVAAQHRAEDHYDSDYGKHGSPIEREMAARLPPAARHPSKTSATRASSESSVSPCSAVAPLIDTDTRRRSPHHSSEEARTSTTSFCARSASSRREV